MSAVDDAREVLRGLMAPFLWRYLDAFEAAVRAESAGLTEAARVVVDHYIGKDATIPMLTWKDIAALDHALSEYARLTEVKR